MYFVVDIAGFFFWLRTIYSYDINALKIGIFRNFYCKMMMILQAHSHIFHWSTHTKCIFLYFWIIFNLKRGFKYLHKWKKIIAVGRYCLRTGLSFFWIPKIYWIFTNTNCMGVLWAITNRSEKWNFMHIQLVYGEKNRIWNIKILNKQYPLSFSKSTCSKLSY